jgi:SOS-response transcriptional repressor LexA
MNPPSDEKLRRLEQALAFKAGELLTQAHLQRTPRDVRAVLNNLMKGSGFRVPGSGKNGGENCEVAAGVNLDDAYLSGVLQEMVERSAGNVEHVASNAAPVINRVSAGYPKDFTDLNYPRGVADDYVACPDLNDPQAFAARVHGDSMTPKYREGDIVIFSPAAAPKNGDDCFVRFADGHTTFKRAFFETDKGQEVIRLQPRNEKYRAQVVKAEELTGVYKAVFKYQKCDEE